MKSLNLIHTVFAFSPIWLTSLISHVSATGTLAVTSAIETVHEDKRRRAAAVMKIHNDDLLNMPTFTFDDGSDSAVFTKIQATRRVLASGVEEVIWEGTVTKSDEYGFATLLRYDDGPVAASFTTSVAAYELDTTAKGAVQLTSTLWEDVKTGMGVVPSRNESTSSSRFEPAGLVAAGSSYPDLGGTITTSTGAAASLIDSAPQHLRSRELQAGPVVDVLVLITNKAMCRVAGLASGCENSSANRKPVEDKLALAQQQSNSAVQSVGVPLTFRFVRVIVLVPEFDANPDVAALDSMRDSPVVQGWMDEAGADLVALLTGSIPANSPAGIAYINRPESVTSVDFLSTFTFTHELGHNFGSLHDRLNLGCGLTHPYGHALQVPNQFRTVMAYSCSGGSVCPVIPFFSASGFRFRDISMGDATHDNARLIRENAPAVAAWRPTRTNTAPMAAPIPAQVPVAVPMQVPNAAPAAASPQASSMWCPNNASSKCPVGTNLMRRRRLIFFCTASCLTNELASSNEFRRWHCGGC